MIGGGSLELWDWGLMESRLGRRGWGGEFAELDWWQPLGTGGGGGGGDADAVGGSCMPSLVSEHFGLIEVRGASLRMCEGGVRIVPGRT